MYRPRRSSERWMEQAPEYVLACYYKSRVVDCYTVLLGGSLTVLGRSVQYLAMSENPARGFSQWGEMLADNRRGCGKHIRWLDLPANVRQHVVLRATTD